MQTITTTTNIPQSIGNTVTVGDPREKRRQEAEIARAESWLDQRLSRARREVFSEEVTVTPILAAAILRKNPDNRPLTLLRLAELKGDLIDGRWVFNGETIIISRDGLLNDGQHRLVACRESGVSIRTIIVFGVERGARLTTDQGSARTTANFLAMEGHEENAKVVAAMGRMIAQFKANGGQIRPGAGAGGNKGSRYSFAPTKAKILEAIANDRAAIERSAKIGTQKGHKFAGTASLVGFCHYAFSKVDQVAASNFIEKLLVGSNLTEGDPIHTLRQRFVNEPKMRQADRYEAIVRAWNAYRGSRQLGIIKIHGVSPSIDGLKAL